MCCALQRRVDITSFGSAIAVVSMVVLTLVLIGVFWVSRTYYLVIAGETVTGWDTASNDMALNCL